MAKPLELVAWKRNAYVGLDGDYPIWEHQENGAVLDRDPNTFGRNIDRWDYDEDKRLTDAELAAEYWATAAQVADRPIRVGDDGRVRYAATRLMAETLHRFATLPHYDEETTTP